MKLTIIVDDNAVYKDRVSFAPVDLSGVPSNVHALQFDTITSTGHIELKDGPNQMITTLPDWAVTSSTNYDIAVAAHNAAEAAKAAALFATKDQ
jgi:hypothetical protein